MIVTLDVSAAIEILLKKEKKDLFDLSFKKASGVVSPDLFVSEISKVLWKYHQKKLITHEECVQYVEDGINLIDDFVDARDLWKEALGEGIRNNHSIYDMYYLVLTRRNDGTLITNDGPLAGICEKQGIKCVF